MIGQAISDPTLLIPAEPGEIVENVFELAEQVLVDGWPICVAVLSVWGLLRVLWAIEKVVTESRTSRDAENDQVDALFRD